MAPAPAHAAGSLPKMQVHHMEREPTHAEEGRQAANEATAEAADTCGERGAALRTNGGIMCRVFVERQFLS